MDYPNLLLAIRAAGRLQYQVAHAAGIREGRLSEIVRRGGATGEERRALSRALGKKEDAKKLLRQREHLVDSGAAVTAQANRVTFEDAAADFLNDYTTNKRRSLKTVQLRLKKTPHALLRTPEADVDFHRGRPRLHGTPPQ